jgi:hypothetical protein
MPAAGDIISYTEMCQNEGISLQKGMNFRLGDSTGVILMSRRRDAPYEDQIQEDGRVLVYEGHDVSKKSGGPDLKKSDKIE